RHYTANVQHIIIRAGFLLTLHRGFRTCWRNAPREGEIKGGRVTDGSLTTVDVRGFRTSVRMLGSGRPLLFLRGFDVGFNDDVFIAALQPDFKIIVPDHPSFGRSDLSDYGGSVSDLAWFYLDFLDALAIPTVHLLGASIGGWIAA